MLCFCACLATGVRLRALGVLCEQVWGIITDLYQGSGPEIPRTIIDL